MEKTFKFYLIIFIYLFSILLIIPKSLSDENAIFLTLKNNEVNLRQGPSFEYPIKIIFKKKYLPVIIIDTSETWRKVIDFENNSGWVHISQLSKKKSAINIKNNSIIYKRPTIFSKPIAKLENGRLVIVKKCKDKWCKIKSGDYDGWIFKNTLWGKLK
jgi:SH3-like domain-containing protein